ncbi:hypothetical protein Ferp_1950 [Ferroglobus placidus DSM 10642]|uniref:Uncharacterized protein n=1 Tax=Ferroglobus placidus (strain DSM 10642 / AEDII12DO) TaxID=589924 RepID=D3S024_FERPA|nr:hypothetical protein [Ferroglobus placidus]ADC66087.1 hypothetical protein Ferp_1950 [Ferroglobus placidus DSM 10642]
MESSIQETILMPLVSAIYVICGKILIKYGKMHEKSRNLSIAVAVLLSLFPLLEQV